MKMHSVLGATYKLAIDSKTQTNEEDKFRLEVLSRSANGPGKQAPPHTDSSSTSASKKAKKKKKDKKTRGSNVTTV